MEINGRRMDGYNKQDVRLFLIVLRIPMILPFVELLGQLLGR